VSYGIGNSEEEIETLIHVLGKIAQKPEKSGNNQTTSPKNGIPVLPKTEVQKQMKEFVEAASHRVFPLL